jgi:hypothetical protein
MNLFKKDISPFIAIDFSQWVQNKTRFSALASYRAEAFGLKPFVFVFNIPSAKANGNEFFQKQISLLVFKKLL